jgi:hypothetical protein
MIRSEQYSLYDQLMRGKVVVVQDKNYNDISIQLVYVNNKTGLKFKKGGKVIGVSMKTKVEIDLFISGYEVKSEELV